MTTFGRTELQQRRLPGTDGAEVMLVLHPLADGNYTQRVTIARRSVEQTRPRYHDIVLTGEDIDVLVGELTRRRDALTGDVPHA